LDSKYDYQKDNADQEFLFFCGGIIDARKKYYCVTHQIFFIVKCFKQRDEKNIVNLCNVEVRGLKFKVLSSKLVQLDDF
jgi:hypothetical protein